MSSPCPQEHFREYSRQSAAALASMTELSCDQCPRKFRYRKALDHHVKKAHSELVKKEQSGQKIIEPDLNKILRTCNICEKIVESEWYLPPSRHNCPGGTTQVKDFGPKIIIIFIVSIPRKL